MASQFGFIINVLVNAFFAAYQPQLYKYLSNFTQENKYKMLRMKYLFAGFLLLSTVLLSVLVPFAYKWFINKNYQTGIKYVAWNAFGFFFWGLYALLLGILYYYKKNRAVITISVFSTVLCIGLNYFFVKNYGVIGACYANIITYVVLFITIFIAVSKMVHLQLPWLQLGKIFNTNSSKL
jgi:O-antigen/teichoic acid export membrane protein